MYDLLVAPFADFEFMRRALAASIALALGAAPIGVFLMLRRMSLVGDAMAHAILPGAREIIRCQHLRRRPPCHLAAREQQRLRKIRAHQIHVV